MWYKEQYLIFLCAGLIIAIVEFCVLLSIILTCTRIPSKSTRSNKTLHLDAVDKSSMNTSTPVYPAEDYLPSTCIYTVPDIRETYIQPPTFRTNKPPSSFKKKSNHYHISKSYLV